MSLHILKTIGKTKFHTYALCTFGAVHSISPAFAADADEPVYSQLKGVTSVTAKSQRDTFEIAESISVIDRETIEQEQPANIGDLLLNLANVDIAGGPRGIAQQIIIRGVGNNRVLFVMDGARQNFSRAHSGRGFVDPELLKQVEVMRGPASALWGSGAIGGVVALTTKDAADMLKPGETAGARLKGGYHDVNSMWSAGGSAYGITGDFDLLFDYNHRDADDTKLGDGATLGDSAFTTDTALFKASWQPNEKNRVSATLQKFDESGHVPTNAQIGPDPSTTVDRDTVQTNLSLRFEHESETREWLNPSLLLYRNLMDVSESRLIDGREDDTEIETRGLDLRNRAVFASGENIVHTLTAGVDYFEDDAEGKRDGAPRPSFPTATQEVGGIYVQDEILINENLTIVPGLRFDDYESDSGSVQQDETKLSQKLSFSYQVNEWMSLHAAYNEAFRAPGMNELFVSGTHFSCGPGCANLFIANPDLKPEKAHNKEIGLKLRKDSLFQAGDKARLSVNVFQNDVEDFIDQIVDFTFAPVPGNPGPGGVSFFENVTDATLKGFEVDMSYEANNWKIGAAYGLTRGDNEVTNEPLSDIPADKLTLNASIKIPANNLELGWSSRFIDKQNRVPASGTPTGSYDLHNIRATWRPAAFGKKDDVRINFGVDNIFDEDYRPHNSVLKGPGRNVKASLAVNF